MSPVKPDPLQTEALHREAAWLKRRRGILALLGFGLGLSIGRLLWNLVLLNSSDLPGPWMDWFRARNLLLGGALALLPGIWGLGLRREQVRPGAGRRWPLAPLLALLGVAAIDICLQSYTGQSLFWQAVRARSGHQHQAREVSLYREEAAACRKKSQIRPGIVLAGSSQILYGVDAAELARRTGKPVYRRAVAGMFLPELAASRDFLVFHPENHVVLWLSGFDLGARDTLYADAIRPQATPTGIRHLLGAAGGAFRLRHWRTYADLLLAATTELWRSRDYARFLLEHPFSPAGLPTEAAPSDDALRQERAYEQLGSNPAMVRLGLQVLSRLLADLSAHCRQVTVVEGRVNPAYPSSELSDLSAELRQCLEDARHRDHIHLIPIEEQLLDLPESFWRDMTHVTPEGRQRLTEELARLLSVRPAESISEP